MWCEPRCLCKCEQAGCGCHDGPPPRTTPLAKLSDGEHVLTAADVRKAVGK